LGGEAQGRRKVCSAKCTRWATARAAACLMAARAFQKYSPQRNLKASSLEWLIIPELRKQADGPAVGNNVEALGCSSHRVEQ